MERFRLATWLPLLFALAGGLTFWGARLGLEDVKRLRPGAEIEVVLPVFVQVALSGGDRHLAATWSTIRALVTETARMAPEEYRILALVQQDAAWLNPAHEDNYYVAAAILPWEGEVDPTQVILRRATLARPFDFQPPFYYAFNQVHFKGDALGASEWLRFAAGRLHDSEERLTLEDFAARWLDRTHDLDSAARVVDAMAGQARRKDFAAYLRQRSQRLRDLAALRRAATDYTARHQRPPGSLDDLVRSGLIAQIPKDPFGSGFAIDQAGVPVIAGSLARSTQ
ncbi:hypothetical protein [Accumulibacter sp.]|uniref:hypothetical protein n=1 Tax=Accumulibacter sp. TaxID=2053492 RepID=UPI00287B0F46|nr:hypothetical protein [Accumulibacter sp.]MDS4055164.1 hypothetical protein [Accumulibacter sp.]HMW57706.1 hypothetical protein [Accumulibacter sp.]